MIVQGNARLPVNVVKWEVISHTIYGWLYTTLDQRGAVWDYPFKRIGHLKTKWIAEGTQDRWTRLRTDYPDTLNARLASNVGNTRHADNAIITQTITQQLKRHPERASNLTGQHFSHTRHTRPATQPQQEQRSYHTHSHNFWGGHLRESDG